MMPFSCFTESTPTEESEEMILRESLDQEKLKYVLTMSELCVAQQYIFFAKKVHCLDLVFTGVLLQQGDLV